MGVSVSSLKTVPNLDLKKGEGTTNENKNTGDKPQEKPEAEPEAEAEKPLSSIDDIKAKNVKMWMPYLNSILIIPDIKNDLKKVFANALLANPTVITIADEGSEKDPDEQKYINEKVYIEKDDMQKFVNGKDDYQFDFSQYIDKELLFKPDLKKAAEATSVDKDSIRSLKEDIKTATEEIKLIYKSMVKYVKDARKKHALMIVLNYIKDSDKLKRVHKNEKITTTDEAIALNKTEIKGRTGGDGGSISGSDGGSYGSSYGTSDGDGTSEGGSISSTSEGGSISSTGDGSSISSTSEGGSDGDGEGGGRFFKTPEEKALAVEQKQKEKAYEEKKKGTRADFETKKEMFFKDTLACYTFINENKNDLLIAYEKKKLSKNVTGENVSDELLKKFIDFLDKYEEKDDDKGAAGEEKNNGPASTTETPPSTETPPATSTGDKPAETAPSNADTGDAPPAETEGGAPAGKADTGGSALPIQSGGAAKPKKKRHTRKKGKCINISINVGDKNVVTNDSTSSDSSSSDSSSDSSSTSSDTSSESEGEGEGANKKKKNRKKKKKYNLQK